LASLASRLTDLITAIGADIKALQNRTNDQHNASTGAQSGISGDTYLVGSSVTIPQGKVKVGTKYRCRFNVVKTAAGTGAPVISVRVGTAASVADTARAALTFAAQTGVIDEGDFVIDCAFRQAGATALIQANGSLIHRLVTTGLNTVGVYTSIQNTGAAFDVTGANLKMGLSVNAPNPSSWTVNFVGAELVNLTP
jgi:hypothetical protein